MIRVALLFSFMFCAPLAQAAFEFSPIISTLAPSGAAATTSFTVSNPSDTKIPVQISIVAREPDENGKEIYAETEAVSDMFRIFPAQVVLNPKESRAVRVSYVGTPKLKTELAFRIIAEELPVDVTDPKKVYKKAVANVSIAIKYVGSLYVTPSGSKSELELKVESVTTGKEKNLLLTVINKGSTHEIIRKPMLKLQSISDNTEVVLSAAEVATMSNLNILAGKTRKFTMEWPKKLPVGPVKASFDVVKE